MVRNLAELMAADGENFLSEELLPIFAEPDPRGVGIESGSLLRTGQGGEEQELRVPGR